MDPWYRHVTKVQTWTHGIDNSHGFKSDSWYIIGTPESDTYKRAECCPFAGFFYPILSLTWSKLLKTTIGPKKSI